MRRTRKIQTPGVTAPAEQQEVIEQAAQAVEQAPAEQSVEKYDPKKDGEPGRPHSPRWVLKSDGWHYE